MRSLLTVEHCISLDTAQLRRQGLLTGKPAGGVNQKWRGEGVVIGDVWLAVEPRDASLTLTINGTCFDQPIRQAVQLVEKPMPFGGRRFFMECEATGGLCCRMILPPGGVSFRSGPAWGLRYRSQSQDAATRAYSALRKVERKIGRLSPCAHMGTRIKLMEQKVEREAYMARLDEYVATALAEGKRLSMRKAARWAKEQAGLASAQG